MKNAKSDSEEQSVLRRLGAWLSQGDRELKYLHRDGADGLFYCKLREHVSDMAFDFYEAQGCGKTISDAMLAALMNHKQQRETEGGK